MSLIPIVNLHDEVIDYKDRLQLLNTDIYRVSALWVTNTKGDILLAQRAFTKSHSPGKWGPAVAGTVEKDQTYLENVVIEAQEELGLTLNIDELTVGPKLLRKTKWIYFCQVYVLTRDIPVENLKLQKDEVIAIKWYSKDDLQSELTTFPDKFLESVSKFYHELKDFQS